MILHRGLKYNKLSEDLPLEFKGLFREVPVMYQLYDAALKEMCTKLEILDTELEISMQHNPIHHIESRLKSLRSISQKLAKHDLPISMENIRERILDVAGIRVVCNYVEDIYFISERLCKQSDIRTVLVKDYIQNPKESGYRSMHIIIEVPVFLSERTETVPVEIQFRTVTMDMWASLEHEIKYKSKNVLTEEDEMKIKECSIKLANVDYEMQRIYDSLRID